MMVKISFPRFTKFQAAVHIAALLPLILLIFNWTQDNLTFNPIQALELRTGKYALVLLILSLACTPINTVFGFKQALKVRRPLGLYAFLYASIHFLIFIGLDYQFDLVLLQEAIFEKRYALVGFSAGLILLVLALTSTRGWMKRMGKTWSKLHKFVYLAGILVIIHYIWLVKSDIRVPLLYGGVVLLLLVARIPYVRRQLSRIRQHKLIRMLHDLPGSIKRKIIPNPIARSVSGDKHPG
ncbi:MAG: protein-methionine-sulfoxide reductase heme-binding subunit MsrQ [Anaerolineales bacterium]|nr:sulfoxide reductase heme-binding subunit YedZ [Anaerolineales bacterium]